MISKDEIICVTNMQNWDLGEVILIIIGPENDRTKYELNVFRKNKTSKELKMYDVILSEINLKKIIKNNQHKSLLMTFQDKWNLYAITDYTPFVLLNLPQMPLPFPAKVIQFYAAEIFLALLPMRENTIKYSFLHPINIFLDDKGHVKLDCHTTVLQDEFLVSELDCAEFLPPEYGYSYQKNCLFWSFGVVLFIMFTGKQPFRAETYEQIRSNVKILNYQFPNKISESGEDLIRRFLTHKDKRWGYEDVVEVFTHPFFKGIDWEKIRSRANDPPIIPNTSVSEETIKYLPKLSSIFPISNAEDGDGYGDLFERFLDFDVLNQ